MHLSVSCWFGLPCLLFVVHLVGAPFVGEEIVEIGVSDLFKLADHGVLSSRLEAERIWAALRASQLKESHSGGEGNDEQKTKDASDVTGAVRDLQRLLSLTNLLYCIATTLLTAVFTFLLFEFRERHAVQAGLALGYASVFVYWGLQLLSIGVVSNSASEGASGSQLIGGALLMVPNIAAVAMGAAAVEICTGTRWPRLWEQWQSMESSVVTDNKFCLACLILASSVMAYSGALHSISKFPLLLVPFLGSLYLVSISIGLILTKKLISVVWVSILHSFALWFLAHSGLLGADISLGLMISACNSAFWSFPYILITLPMGLTSDQGLELLESHNSNFDAWIQSELWAKPSFVVSLLFYIVGNIAVLYYGLHIKSWVPLPYALIGVVVTMLLANHAPPRMRMAWRILYNLPMALLLFAASSAYERITDTLWLGVLAWLGQPHHFRIIAIFFVRGATLICAMWSLWYGLSRLFPSRIVKDLKETEQMLEDEKNRLTEIQNALQEGRSSTSLVSQTSMFSRLFRRQAPAPTSQSQEQEKDKLRAELNLLKGSEETRRRRLASVQSMITKFEANGFLSMGSIPMCWVGYAFSAAVCDAPEPFSLLAFALNVNSLIYISRGFGGLVLSAVGAGAGPKPRFAEWRGDVPLKFALPMLVVCGVRVVALAENSFLRNVAGVVLLGASLTGVLRVNQPLPGTLAASALCVGIMAYGLLCDLRLLIILCVICLYCLAVYLLVSAMGQNVVSMVCAITALALGTMHLGMSYETYFLALQKVAGGGMPFGETLHALVTNPSIEKRMSLTLVRSIETLFKL